MNSIRKEVLTSANEDYFLLWEVAAGVKNVLGEKATDPSKPVEAASREIVEQIRKGWIKLYRTTRPKNHSDFTVIPDDEAQSILTRPEEFRYPPDPDGPWYWILTTKLGEEVWESGAYEK